jgi:hypothetical protein
VRGLITVLWLSFDFVFVEEGGDTVVECMNCIGWYGRLWFGYGIWIFGRWLVCRL